MSFIESRIMELKFDNADFVNSVDESIDKLDELEEALDFDEAVDGFDKLDEAAKDVDLSKLEKGVDAIKRKFTSFHLASAAILEDLAVKVANFGRSMVLSATVQPIRSGFQEYETQINAVQTILANTSSKGTTLDQVNDALDELNHYADMTIYNFTEMTRNIGTFTAAGVDLDTSVQAIKGIANLAAASGSTSLQASTAMYQLSQALAAGKINLQDWNSVVNAGMGGELFKQSLMETARVHGIAIDKIIADEGSFRESISKGWITNEILLESLQKFTGDLSEEQLKQIGYTDEQIKGILELGKTANDAATKVKTFTQLFDTLAEARQSGWTQTWEILIGDFEEAKTVLTALSDYFSDLTNKSAAARNEMLELWKKVGGRDRAIQGIKSLWTSLMTIVEAVSKAMNEVFPKLTWMDLNQYSAAFERFAIKIEVKTKKAKDNFYRLAKGIFSLFDAVLTVVKQFGSSLANVFGKILPESNFHLLDLLGNFGDFLTYISELIKNSGIIQGTFKLLEKVISPFAKAINNTATGIGNFINSLRQLDIGEGPLSKLGTSFLNTNEKTEEAIDGLKGAFDKILDVFASFGEASAGAVQGIKDAISTIVNSLATLYQNININNMIDTFINLAKTFMGIGIIDILFKIREFLEKGNIVGLLTSLGEVLEEMDNDFKAKVVFTIAGAVAALAAALLLLSMVPEDKVLSSLGAVGALMAELSATTFVFTKMMASLSFGGVISAGTILLGLASAVLVLSTAMYVLGKLNWDEIIRGLAAVGGLLLELSISTALISRFGTKHLFRMAAGLVVLSLAIGTLANIVGYFAEMDWEKIGKGLAGVGGLLAEIVIFLGLNKAFRGKLVLKTAASLAILATAIKILSQSVVIFAEMDVDKLSNGIIALGAILGELMIFSVAMRNLGSLKLIPIATSFTILGGAMIIFAEAMRRMGEIPYSNLAAGIASMAATLFMVVAAVWAMPLNGIIQAGISLNLIAASLIIFSEGLSRLGSIPIDVIKVGLATMAGVLAEVAIASILMRKSLPAAASLAIISGSLLVLFSAFDKFSKMNTQQIGMGIMAIASALLTVVAASAVASTMSGMIITASIALAAFGAALLLVGGGMTALNVGLTSLAATIGAFGFTLTGAVATVFTMVPAFITSLGESIAAFLNSLSTVGTAVLEFLRTMAPLLGGVIMEILTVLLEKAAEFVPRMTVAGMQLLEGLLNGIADNIEPVVEAAVNLYENFMNAFAEQIPRVIDVTWDFVEALVEGIADAIEEHTGIPVKAFWEMGVQVIEGFVKGIQEKFSLLWEKASGIGRTALEAVRNMLGIASPSKEFALLGEYSAEGYAQGLTEGKDIVVDAVNNLMYEAIPKETDEAKYEELGEAEAEALARGLDNKQSIVVGSVDRNVSAMLNQFDEYTDQFYEAGQTALLSFLVGFTDRTEDIVDRTQEMIDNLKAEISDWVPELTEAALENKDKLNAVKELGEYLEPTVDTSNVELGKIDALMNLLVEHMSRWMPKFQDVGRNMIDAYGKGFTSSTTVSLGQIDNLCQQFISKFRSYVNIFEATGRESLLNYVAGLVQSPAAKTIAAMVGATIDAQIGLISEETLDEYKELGKQSMEAVTEGMSNSTSIAMGGMDYIMLTMIEQLITWMDKFSETGTYIGEIFMESFVSQMIGAGEAAKVAGETMGISSLDGVEGITAEFYAEGEEVVEEYAEGIEENQEIPRRNFEEITEEAKLILQESQPAYYQLGADSVNSIVAGIKKRADEPPGVMDNIISTTLGDMRKRYDDWSEVGGYLVEGFTKGIRDHIESAARAAAEMAAAARRAAEAELDENSPSKEFYRIGRYVVEGFANGVNNMTYLAENATSEMGRTSMDSMREAISNAAILAESDIDLQPRITPVLDLSEIDREKGKIDAALRPKSITAMATGRLVDSVARQMGEAIPKRDDATTESEPKTTEIIFNQNNYSPKALSRIEIYRQTKNQLSGLKGVIV